MRSRLWSAFPHRPSSSTSRSAGQTSAVWGTLQEVSFLPILGAVACMGSSTGSRRRAGGGSPTRGSGSALRRDGRGRGRGEQRAARACRRPAPRAVGLAGRLLRRPRARDGRARPRLRHPRAGRVMLASLPLVTDEGWVDRIVVGSVLVLVVLAAVIALARSYTAPASRPARAPRSPAAVRPATRWRGSRTRSPWNGAGLVRAQRCGLERVGARREPRRARRRCRALAGRGGLRHRRAQPRRHDSVLARLRRHLSVAGRVRAGALRRRA